MTSPTAVFVYVATPATHVTVPPGLFFVCICLGGTGFRLDSCRVSFSRPWRQLTVVSVDHDVMTSVTSHLAGRRLEDLEDVKKGIHKWYTRALPRYCSLQYLPRWRRDVSNRLPAPVSVPRRTWRQIAQSGRQSICKITKVTLYSQSALKHAKLCVFFCYYLPRKYRDVINM